MNRIIGSSGVAEALRKHIERIASTEARVLILGENGTGKELVASAIHAHSKRASKPFVTLNCAAVPSELIESELFGHEKGAFTGADRQRSGRFEQADGGTLFLDEVGDMPLQMQAKLLRVLQDGSFQRVGGKVGITVDVRVLAATNRDLHTAIRERRFRQDLYYRLAVLTVRTPALRERLEDIPLLVQSFFASSARPDLKLALEAEALLRTHSWPGNVRELMNVAERLVVLAGAEEVQEVEAREALDMDRQYQALLEVDYNQEELAVHDGMAALTAALREQSERTRELLEALLTGRPQQPTSIEIAQPGPAQEALALLPEVAAEVETLVLVELECLACGDTFHVPRRVGRGGPTYSLRCEACTIGDVQIRPRLRSFVAMGELRGLVVEALVDGFIGVELTEKTGERLEIPRYEVWPVADAKVLRRKRHQAGSAGLNLADDATQA